MVAENNKMKKSYLIVKIFLLSPQIVSISPYKGELIKKGSCYVFITALKIVSRRYEVLLSAHLSKYLKLAIFMHLNEKTVYNSIKLEGALYSEFSTEVHVSKRTWTSLNE